MDDYVVIDFETGSACNLKTAGVVKYSKDRTTHVQCLAWCWPTGGADLWAPSMPIPQRLAAHVAARRPVVAHNAPFELAIWNNTLCRAPGWPSLTIEQTDCTMARARALALPASLEQCARALRLPVVKDDAGHKVMMKLCRPRSKDPIEFWTPETAPDLFAALYEYCKTDTLAQRGLHKVLTPLSEKERALWVLDRYINQRGVPIDIESAIRVSEVVKAEKSELSRRVHINTCYASTATTVKNLLEWLQGEEIEVENLKKDTIAKLLADPAALEGKDGARLVLELRQQASKVSTAKLTAMRNAACEDGAARDCFNFSGANTRRWTSARVQFQNLKRSSKKFGHREAADVIDWLRFDGAANAIRLNYGSVMDSVSMSIRSFIKARPGKRFISVDYSNIEGRVLAWEAREEWKLEAFKLYDTIIGTDAKGEPLRAGPDLYNVAYARSFGVDIETVDDGQRQIGKVQELACGYQGGIGSYISMGQNYGVVPGLIADAVKRAVPVEEWDKAASRLPKMGSKFRYDLPPHEWTGLRVVVDGWRRANPNIVKLWHLTEQAAIEAVQNPGTITAAGRVHMRVAGDFLLIRLPSGGALSCPYPAMKRKTTLAWDEQKAILERQIQDALLAGQTDLVELNNQLKAHIDKPEYEMKLTYWGVSSKQGSAKKWKEQYTYGGHLVERCTQGIARDILAEAMPVVERAGYPIVLHVHDELVAEVDKNKGSVKELAHIMCACSPWAAGLPIAAAGWEGERYRK